MVNHLQSGACQKTSKSKGLGQLSLSESWRTGVWYIFAIMITIMLIFYRSQRARLRPYNLTG